MATRTNGVNGHTNGLTSTQPLATVRFSDIPSAIDIPVPGLEGDEQAVELDLEDLLDDPTELCTLLENERAARTYWMTVSLAYCKQRKVDHAIEMLLKGLNAAPGGQKEKLSMLSCLCWLYLWKSREAPRVAPEGTLVSEAKTKEYYLQQSTTTLNDASRINPAFPPLFLARGVLYLLRASLQPPSKSAAPGAIDTEKLEILRHALKSFEDAIRVSQGRNMLAVLGKARALFSLGKFSDALEGYQEALHKMPELIDPDPRIGIGCCFWQLGFKDDAKAAWARSLELNPESKIANILLGLYHLDASAHVPTNGKEFIELYKKAMTEYTQKAFKADKNMPLTCSTFAGYFLSRKSLDNAGTLAHKAIQYTDVNAIASDGWYILARKEHYSGDLERASDYYRRADEARGGIDRGYLPAKFGAAQLSAMKGDFGEAKLRLEKMIQQSKNTEAMTLLGTIYAEEVFASQYSNLKEDKSTEYKKAIGFLETVRNAWRDPKKNLIPDASVLLNLARLYEVDQPDKSLQCLQQVEQIEIDQLPAEMKEMAPDEDEAAFTAKLRENLPPQLLNNMGCFNYQTDKYERARENFQAALNACVKAGEKREDIDTDALVTTISYNLGRTYEASGLLDEAKTVYEGLLGRHSDYIDARTRLTYIALRQSPTDEGPRAVAKLYQDAPSDLEVRALYGWYLGRVHSRKRTPNIAEDPELRHYKHTLQNYEKHDRYALIGMGNLYLQSAREMRRETEPDKAKRSAMYSKAVEFFDKALQLDPKNAYAAQGIAIALAEDKGDAKNAMLIFTKVRDTINDANVFIHCGHIFADLKQYGKAIEHYEVALSKGRGNDAQLLACLGRAWLAKARDEKKMVAFKNALEYSKRAVEVAPELIHLKFNVAFVQVQIATHLYNTNENSRSLAELEEAAAGLDEAVESLEAIAQHPQTPYPKHLIEGRANMARNTMRKQLERSIQSQKEYETRNAEKLQHALEEREAELKRRAEEQEAKEAAERERKRLIAEERAKIAEHDRILAEQRAEEDREREAAEMTTDSETGERVKRKKRPARGGKRKKKEDETSGEESAPGSSQKRAKKEKESGIDSDGGKPKKKRRLAKKPAAKKDAGKYKSSEVIVESDDEGQAGGDADGEKNDMAAEASGDGWGPNDKDGSSQPVDDAAEGSDDDEVAAAPVVRKNRTLRIESDDEDEDGDEVLEDAPSPADQAAAGGEASAGEASAKGDGDGDGLDTTMTDADAKPASDAVEDEE